MPIYQSRCKSCGAIQDYYQTVEGRANTPWCCGAPAEKVILPAQVIPDIPAYESPIDGHVVEGRAARREDLKRSGCRPWEGLEAEKREAARQRGYTEQHLERKLDEAVKRTFYELPPIKRRILKGE